MVRNKPEASLSSMGVLKKSNISVMVEPNTGAFDKNSSAGKNYGSIDINSVNDETGLNIKGKKLSQWGNNNLLPNDLKELFKNNIIPGLFDFKQDMFFGLGPSLYTRDSEGKAIPFYDQEIIEWLESWNYIEFLIAMFADAAMYENMFVKVIPNEKGNKIHSLKHVDADECRISVKNKNGISDTIFVNNWKDKKISDADVYPAYNIADKTSKVSMLHLMKKSASFRYYAMPVYIGVIDFWLPLANEIPKFHLARMQQSLNIKYHIKVPLRTLEQVRNINKWSKDELDKWFQDKLDEIDNMLAGAENAGKTFYTFIENDSNGKEMTGWQIEEVKNNEKEMSEANLQLYNETNQAITSAMQVQPSLACIQLGQKMSSGSEILNAYNLHVKTRTPIIRYLSLKAINMAIKINWPDKKAFLAINDPLLVKQEVDKSGVIDSQI